MPYACNFHVKLRLNTPPPYQRSMTVNSIELQPTGTAGIKAELASPKPAAGPAAALQNCAPLATSLGFGASDAMSATAIRARELLEARRVKAKTIAASVPPPKQTLEGQVLPKVAAAAGLLQNHVPCLPPPAKSSEPGPCITLAVVKASPETASAMAASKTALKAPPAAKHISWAEPLVKSSSLVPVAANAVPKAMAPAKSALAVPMVSPAGSAIAVPKVLAGSAVAVPMVSPAGSAVAVPKTVSPAYAGSAIAVPKTVSPPASKEAGNQQAPKGKDKAENAELSKAIGKVHVLGNEVACLIICWILHVLPQICLLACYRV